MNSLPEKSLAGTSIPMAVKTGVAIAIAAFAFWELQLVAWVGDDAAITLRTVMNMMYGYGPVFNPGERVQAFTHPLWFILLSLGTLLYPHVFEVCVILSIGLSLTATMLLTNVIARDLPSTLLLACILLCCKSYVDYSASGLENPLANVLLMIFAILTEKATRKKHVGPLRAAAIAGSLCYLTRPDIVLIIAPLALYVTIKLKPSKKQILSLVICASLPALCWTIFSVIYYGIPFPNTAYVKLRNGPPLADRVFQGWLYFQQSFAVDPVTLSTIAAALVTALFSKPTSRALGIGVTLFLLYILQLGGDFMSGRFLVPALTTSLIILSGAPRLLAFFGIPLALIGMANFKAAILEEKKLQTWDVNGIADERRYYWPNKNFSYLKAQGGIPDYNPLWQAYDPKKLGRVEIVCGGLGYRGLDLGPAAHLIDSCALADPLLARLPSVANCRVGHYLRNVPTNYLLSVFNHENQLVDDDVKQLYDQIRLLTRGPLFSKERWRAIYDINFGRLPDVSRWRTYSPPSSSKGAHKTVAINRLRDEVIEHGGWLAFGNLTFGGDLGNFVDIVLPTRETIEVIDISVDGNDRYAIEFWDGASFQPLFELGPRSDPEMLAFILPRAEKQNDAVPSMVRYKRPIEGQKPSTDRIRVVAIQGEEAYSVGHLKIR